jgi:predicted transcriptional regulator
LDDALRLVPGTYAQAEAGRIRFSGPLVMRLREMVRQAELAGEIPLSGHVGHRLKQARLTAKKTQRFVADACNWPQSRVSRLEMSSNPRTTSTKKYVESLGLTLDFVLHGTRTQTETTE